MTTETLTSYHKDILTNRVRNGMDEITEHLKTNKNLSPQKLEKLKKRFSTLESQHGEKVVMQEELLLACKNKEAFLQYVDDKGIVSGKINIEISPSTELITEEAFLNIPYENTLQIYKKFKITRSDAAQISTWASVFYTLIDKEIVEPYYLLKNHKMNGRSRIESVMKLKEKPEKKKEYEVELFECVKHILRRFSGCPDLRGKRSLVVDCPFAAAWWKRSIIEGVYKTAAGGQSKKKDVFNALDKSSWGIFAERIVSQLTFAAEQNVRDGIILFLLADEGNNQHVKKPEFWHRLGEKAENEALGLYDSGEIARMFKNISDNLLAK